jgi:hypothetical protein
LSAGTVSSQVRVAVAGSVPGAMFGRTSDGWGAGDGPCANAWGEHAIMIKAKKKRRSGFIWRAA